MENAVIRGILSCVVLFAAAPLLPAQSGGPVEGKVVNTATGQPVKRAIVLLRGIPLAESRVPPETYVVQTDAQGRFSVRNMVPGRYEAVPSREGFQARPRARSNSPAYFPQFVVEPGQSTAPLELRLTPLSNITGRILDDAGRPVTGAFIDAVQNGFNGGRKVLTRVARAETDDHGEYRLFDLSPGRYYLRASNTNQDPPLIGGYDDLGPSRQRAFQTIFYQAALDVKQAAPVDIAPGGETGPVNMTMRRVGIYNIRGKMPARGHVQLIVPGGAGFAYATRPITPETFEISGVLPGSYLVAAFKQQNGREQEAPFAMRRIEVMDTDVDGVDLSQATGTEISGVVRLSGMPSMPEGSLQVVLEPEQQENGTRVFADVKTDGRFTISGVQPDAFIVSVSGPSGVYLKSVRLGTREAPDHRVDGRETATLTLTVANDRGSVTGSVMDTKGAPVAAVRVWLVPDQSLPFWPSLFTSGNTDAAGRFELKGVVPGKYKLFSFADVDVSAPLDPDFRLVYEAFGVVVEVPAAGTASAKLTLIP